MTPIRKSFKRLYKRGFFENHTTDWLYDDMFEKTKAPEKLKELVAEDGFWYNFYDAMNRLNRFHDENDLEAYCDDMIAVLTVFKDIGVDYTSTIMDIMEKDVDCVFYALLGERDLRVFDYNQDPTLYDFARELLKGSFVDIFAVKYKRAVGMDIPTNYQKYMN